MNKVTIEYQNWYDVEVECSTANVKVVADTQEVVVGVQAFLKGEKGDAGAGLIYKVYTALITQSDTSAPTAIVLENTLGGNVNYIRSSPGQYAITSDNLFGSNPAIFTGSSRDPLFVGGIHSSVITRYSNSSYINLLALKITNIQTGEETFVEQFGVINKLLIEIRVYN